MKSGLLLYAIISKSAAILKLLTRKDEALLIRRDTLLVLNLCLDIVNGIRAFNFQSNGLTSERFHKNLHATTQTKDKVESRFLLDVIVGKGAAILKLLSGKDEALLVRGDAFLVLDLGLNVVDGVGAFDLQGDGFAREGLHKDLHDSRRGYGAKKTMNRAEKCK
ncbi:hypothetical protein L7F22_021017 [Adiantum nelumboides]|nr:hypothetical protein [Adiantum nelumboides]